MKILSYMHEEREKLAGIDPGAQVNVKVTKDVTTEGEIPLKTSGEFKDSSLSQAETGDISCSKAVLAGGFKSNKVDLWPTQNDPTQSAMDFNNGAATNVDSISFQDVSQGVDEGLRFPNRASPVSWNNDHYDTLRIFDNKALVNFANTKDLEVIHEENINTFTVQSDWTQKDSTAKDFIKNKPPSDYIFTNVFSKGGDLTSGQYLKIGDVTMTLKRGLDMPFVDHHLVQINISKSDSEALGTLELLVAGSLIDTIKLESDITYYLPTAPITVRGKMVSMRIGKDSPTLSDVICNLIFTN